MLEIRNLHVEIDGKAVIEGLNLTVEPGQVHAVMGPNGSGKSTLAYVMTGREDYEVTKGEILYKGEDLLELEPEERAAKGVFLAFQYPVEIPGVANTTFLKEAVNALRSPDRSMLVITHYQRLLEYIVPDRVHVLAHGKIQRSGDKTLALELERNGYAEFRAAC